MYSPTNSDVKPPALYHLYALSYLVLPAGRPSMILMDTLFGLLGYWAFHRLSLTLYNPFIAWILTATLAAVTNAFIVLDFGTEGFGLAESFMILPASLAALAYIRWHRQPSSRTLLLCGIWLGVDACFKQTALPLILAIITHLTFQSSPRRMLGPRQSSPRRKPGSRQSSPRRRPGSRQSSFHHDRLRRIATQIATLCAGLALAMIPWVLWFVIQGTLMRMVEVLLLEAPSQLAKQTARPDQWQNVLPAWTPMVWAAGGFLWWIESRLRHRANTDELTDSFSSSHLVFLIIWFILECIMLVFLPFRSFHYYVLTALPLVLLSGMIWSELAALRRHRQPRETGACIIVAACLSLALARTTIDTVVPIAIGRFQTYDAQADRTFFDTMATRDIIDFGRPPPSN